MAKRPDSREGVIDQIIGHARAHPNVTQVHMLSSDACELTLGVGIPSGALQRGESNGVREHETIRLEFPQGFPLKAPLVTLREDFNADLPHINPFRPGERVPPCFIDGSVDELFLSRGIGGVLDRLIGWLEDAASGRLIHPEQGWEPARRDALGSIYIADRALLRDESVSEGHTFWLMRIAGDAERGYVARLCEPIKRSPAALKKVLAQSDLSWSIAIVLASASTEVGHYMPDRTETFADLQKAAGTAGCAGHLAQAINFLTGLGVPKPSFERPLMIVVHVRRPYDVLPTDSKVETLGYVWPPQHRSDFTRGDVLPAGHREPCSKALLSRLSGRSSDEPGAKWAAIGGGSLGSKLVLHAARAGLGPELVIDREVLEPHNMARHALTSNAILQQKSRGLVREVNNFGGHAESREADVIDLVARGRVEGGKSAFPRGLGFLLNTTASFSVRECLSTAHERSRVPRVVEGSMLAGGRVGLLTVEGPGRNPSSNDLLALSYAQLRTDEGLASIVFKRDEEGGRLLIGQGCGSTTMAMSDATLSGQAALMGERLISLIQELPSSGELRVSEWLPGGGGASVSSAAVQPFEVARDGATIVRIAPSVAGRIGALSQASSNEVGGVLIGRYSIPGNAFHVVDLIDAPPDSTGAVDRFVLGIAGLASRIEDYRDSVGGALYCVGTWHSHPNGPEPSGIDESTREKMRLHSPNVPMVMLIWSPRGWRVMRVD